MDKDLNKNISSPLVTVVMPVYNASKYLRLSIDSILQQTFRDFILLIINDGSTDDTEAIVLSYQDDRIRFVKNDTNIGLVSTLNKSIGLTDTEFYARMDADDIAVPERLAWQIEFMRSNPEIGVCGGRFEIFGTEKTRISDTPLIDDDIKASLLFSCQILHPSVFIRTNILKESKITFGVPFKYNDEYGHKILELEDYALWFKLKSITKFANLDKVLIRYRIEGQNLTTQRKDLILERKKTFYSYWLNELKIIPSEMNLLIHISLDHIQRADSTSKLVDFRTYLDEILASNETHKIYVQNSLKKVVDARWDQLFYRLPPLGFRFLSCYWKHSTSVKRKHLVYALKFYVNKILGKN